MPRIPLAIRRRNHDAAHSALADRNADRTVTAAELEASHLAPALQALAKKHGIKYQNKRQAAAELAPILTAARV